MENSINTTAVKTAHWLEISAAPEFIARLFDATQALDSDCHYIASGSKNKNKSGIIPYILSLLVLFYMLVILLNEKFNDNISLSPMIFWLMIAGLSAAVIFCAYKIWQYYAAKNKPPEIAQHEGLFIFSDSLVLLSGKYFCYVPKKDIIKFPLLTAGKAEPKQLEMHAHDHEQQVSNISLDFLHQYNPHLSMALDRWMAYGEWRLEG